MFNRDNVYTILLSILIMSLILILYSRYQRKIFQYQLKKMEKKILLKLLNNSQNESTQKISIEHMNNSSKISEEKEIIQNDKKSSSMNADIDSYVDPVNDDNNEDDDNNRDDNNRDDDNRDDNNRDDEDDKQYE